MNAKKLKAIQTELLKRVDEKSEVNIEKVERYVNLVSIYYKLDKSIKDDGVMITIENGSQKFTKPNPAIAEKNKVNSSLIALGKDLGIDIPIGTGENNYNGSDKSKSDLV